MDIAKLLNEHIESARSKPFKWGSHDCATWVGSFVLLVSGIDAVKKYRGQYTDARGAARAIIKLEGCRDLVAVFDKYLARSCVPFAQRGYVVYDDDSGAVGLCAGKNAVFLSPNGVAFVSMKQITHVWEVSSCLL